MKKPSRDWSKIDWSKGTNELAAELGMMQCNVSRLRREHAPHTIKKGGREKIILVDWSKIDWTEKNKTIAERIKCHPSLVSQKRKIFAPNSFIKRGPQLRTK